MTNAISLITNYPPGAVPDLYILLEFQVPGNKYYFPVLLTCQLHGFNIRFPILYTT